MTASHLSVANDGPRIVATNYWETTYARHGYLYLSINAGCFRLLVPEVHAAEADEMASAEHVVVSMLAPYKWQQRPRQHVVEWMAEDNTDEPWSTHLSAGQVDRGPKREDESPTWEARVYVPRNGEPHEALVKPAHLRLVNKPLPCLEPLADTIRRASKGTQ